MDKKSYALTFIDEIKKIDYTEIYSFITKETTYFDIKMNKEISLEDMLKIIEKEIKGKKVEIKRIFESKVCVKVEMIIEQKIINLFFEITNRRISRLEIECA